MQHAHYITRKPVDFTTPGLVLSISHGREGCSYCIHDVSGELLLLVDHPYEADSPGAELASLQAMIRDASLLPGCPGKVFISSRYREKMLVPGRFFKEKYLARLWALHHARGGDDRLLDYCLDDWDAYLLGAIPARVERVFRDTWPACRLLPAGAGFLQAVKQQANEEEECIFLDLHEDYFNLLVTRDGRPLLFNAFAHETDDDILYFALEAARTCHLDNRGVRSFLLGRVNPRGKLAENLSRYWLPPVKISARPVIDLARDPGVDSSPHVHLVNLHACEL